MSHSEAFKQQRALLFAIAYRMLGTVTNAEDVIKFLNDRHVST